MTFFGQQPTLSPIHSRIIPPIRS